MTSRSDSIKSIKLKLNGGKFFNFSQNQTIIEKVEIKSSTFILPLTTSRNDLNQSLSLDQLIPAFTPVAFTEFNAPITFPYDVKVQNIDSKSIYLSKEGSNKSLSPSLSNFERWVTGNGFLHVKNLLTGRGISPYNKPDRIFISCFSTEPLSTQFDKIFKDLDLDTFLGSFLSIFDSPPAVTLLLPKGSRDDIDYKNFDISKNVKIDLIFLPNKYPAHDGFLPLFKKIYPWQVKKDPNKYWIMDLHGLRKSYYMIKECKILPNIISITSNKDSGYYYVPQWCPTSNIELKLNNERAILGGLFSGREIVSGDTSSIFPWEHELLIIKKPNSREMLHFIKPGLHKDSISPTFLSWYFKNIKRELYSGINGERRFCVSCNYCDSICPIGLDPQYLWKLCKNELFEEAEQHGLLRCSGCGLCSYVCPSKLEVSHTIFESKQKWLKELDLI